LESKTERDIEAGNGGSMPEEKNVEAHPLDPYVVDWDGPDDPQNPLNWSSRMKWGNIAVVSSITFLTYAKSIKTLLVL